ncbi:MAG: DUF1538 domain-containing protein [Clostridiales Family XIII bacterium]|jgi:hypothetical protein|nr:DUF1538 domain-containing protein [Clostridiales Family XIII bacterium]
MQRILLEKLQEAVMSLLPISIIVLILNFTITPMPFSVRGLFIIGSVLLILGMAIFSIGAEMAMMPIGEHLGQYLSKSKKILLIVVASLIMGTMVTIAEPDLQILARQVPGVPNMTLTVTVALGLGIFLVIAMLRILFHWQMRYLFAILYAGALIFGIFIKKEYLAVAFDAGGVTTGPFAIPFILALGLGISSVRGGKSTSDDSFGLAAICSIGPIYAVMVLSIFYPAKQSNLTNDAAADFNSISALIKAFLHGFPEYFHEIGIAVAPLIIVFFIFQIFALRLPMVRFLKICVGLLYTYVGLATFLTGVSVGFMPAGAFIGSYVGALPYNFVLLPIGAIMGYFIVLAEPAVHVLVNQVEDLTGGAIKKNTMLRAFSISVGASLALAMLRVLTGISIWWIIAPGYGLAILLSFFVPKIFSAVAFDSGAVASGPMTATFVLPFTIGACEAVGNNVMMDAFGVVAMVAMTPLLTVQVIGLIYQRKINETAQEESDAINSLIVAEAGGQAISSQQIIDDTYLSDVYEGYAAGVNLDAIPSDELPQTLRDIESVVDTIEDDDYIDFEDYTRKGMMEDQQKRNA